MMILASIKEEQSAFIIVRLPFDNPKEKQFPFDDCFDGWANQGVMQFIISMDQLNPGRKDEKRCHSKRLNQHVQHQLV